MALAPELEQQAQALRQLALEQQVLRQQALRPVLRQQALRPVLRQLALRPVLQRLALQQQVLGPGRLALRRPELLRARG